MLNWLDYGKILHKIVTVEHYGKTIWNYHVLCSTNDIKLLVMGYSQFLLDTEKLKIYE